MLNAQKMLTLLTKKVTNFHYIYFPVKKKYTVWVELQHFNPLSDINLLHKYFSKLEWIYFYFKWTGLVCFCHCPWATKYYLLCIQFWEFISNFSKENLVYLGSQSGCFAPTQKFIKKILRKNIPFLLIFPSLYRVPLFIYNKLYWRRRGASGNP